MNLKEKLLKPEVLWHVGAVAAFLIVACVYFYPALKGYTVDSNDVKNWVGTSQEIKDYRENDGDQILWTNSIFAGMPATQISMAWEGRQLPDLFRQVFTLWTPQPINYLLAYFLSFYIMAISFRIKPLLGILGAFAYGFSSYFIVILEAGHNTKAGALGYAPLLIAGFIFAYRWRNWILGVALSGLFMCFELISNHVQITYYFGFILIGLGVVELIRYAKKGELLKFGKITGGLIVAYAIAALVNIGNLKGTQEYAQYTMRGGSDLTAKVDSTQQAQIQQNADASGNLSLDYITYWSYGKGETFTLLVPNFKGGETMAIGDNESNTDQIQKAESMYRGNIKQSNQYWGDQPFTSGPVYVGAIIFLLSILSLIYTKDKARWALLAVSILAILLSWGKNFMGLTEFFVEYFPLYGKFRTVTMILVIVELSLPLLAIMFLHRLYKSREEIAQNIKPFLIATGAVLLLLLGMGAAPGMFNDFMSNQEKEMMAGITNPEQLNFVENYFAELEKVRQGIFRADVWRSFFLVLLGGGLVFAYLRKAFNFTVLAAALTVITLFDLALIDKRYLGTEDKGKGFAQWRESYRKNYPYMAGDAENQIFAMETQNNPELVAKCDSAMNAMKETFSKDISGTEKQRKLDWARFRTFNRYTHFRVLENNNLTSSGYVPYFFKCIGGYHGAKLSRYQDLIENQIVKSNSEVMNMLNMKYVVTPQYDQRGKEVINSKLIQRNDGALGNAWFVKEVKVVENADEEMAALDLKSSFQLTKHSVTPVMVNGQEIEGSLILDGSERVQYVDMNIGSDLSLNIDTLDIPLPGGQMQSGERIVLIKDQQKGLNWGYADMVDSTFNRVFELEKLASSGFRAAEVAVMDKKFQENISGTSYSGDGTIELTSYHPDKLQYRSSSTSDQLAVFSEIYYPIGWKAFVDGNEVPMSRVNFVLRAVEIPAGEHTVTLEFDLDSYHSSGTIAWSASIGIFLLIALGFFMNSRIKGEDYDPNDEVATVASVAEEDVPAEEA